MTTVYVDYATPSVFQSDRQRALLGMSANARRPVRFHGRVKTDLFLMRVAMRALGEAIWSNDVWVNNEAILDPVITVHPDRLFFEAFSQDQSVYALVIAPTTMFETEGEMVTGATNIDFTAWLWAALAEMRSSRETWLRIGPEGFEIKTIKAGGRFEGKVDLPLSWVRGFLNLQNAMAMPGTRLQVRPVDLLAAIRFLRYTKAKVAPRALRYEFAPLEDARLILEPWEHQIPLQGAEHHYAEQRSIRVWGRRRLRLIEPLLPFAENVEIYLKGRALPSFYAVKMGALTFVLGLSGWTGQGWTKSGGFDMLPDGQRQENDTLLARMLDAVKSKYVLSARDAASILDIRPEMAEGLLVRLCRQGRAIYDLQERAFRWRELFETPVDEKTLHPPDLRSEAAARMIAQGDVEVQSCDVRATRKQKWLKTPQGKRLHEIIFRDWHVTGRAGEQAAVEVVVNDVGRIIFGKCDCAFFRENLLNQGPCEHIRALFLKSAGFRKDEPTSRVSPNNL